MKIIVDTYDPLHRRVMLDESAYRHHIIKGHPEMDNELDAIRETIETPVAIYRSRQTTDMYIGERGWWVVVAVDFRYPEYGVIITAWGTYTEPPIKGEQIWP